MAGKISIREEFFYVQSRTQKLSSCVLNMWKENSAQSPDPTVWTFSRVHVWKQLKAKHRKWHHIHTFHRQHFIQSSSLLQTVNKSGLGVPVSRDDLRNLQRDQESTLFLVQVGHLGDDGLAQLEGGCCVADELVSHGLGSRAAGGKRLVGNI